MNLAGVVQVTPRLPTPVVTPFDLLDVKGAAGVWTIASVGDLLTQWVPGATFLAPTMTAPAVANRVTHVLDGHSLRTEVVSWP